MVLSLGGHRISVMTCFNNSVIARFGLPWRLQATARQRQQNP
jgi:hypothetical protein